MTELSFKFGNQTVNPPDAFAKGGLSNLEGYLGNVLTIFLLAGAFLMVIYIVWAGLQWISSSGDKQKLASARGRLTWAIVGFIIMMVAVGIINAIGYLFQVNLLKLF